MSTERHASAPSFPRLRSAFFARAALVGFAAMVAASGLVAYRLGDAYGERVDLGEQRIRRVYNDRGELSMLIVDRDDNGRPDSWTHFEHGRMVRTETDSDEDGVLDRWYDYNDREAVTRVGSSTHADGVPDEWHVVDGGAATEPVSLRLKTK